METKNEQALARALSTLLEVMKRLTEGVNSEEFNQQFRHKHVSPGVSVSDFVNVQRIIGNLEERDGQIKLKGKNIGIAA